MSNYTEDLIKKYKITKQQTTSMAVKSLINAMIEQKEASLIKQELTINEEVFLKCYRLYEKCLEHFDPNYNRKTDFYLFFLYLINGFNNHEEINFSALFCPGYTKYGYKDHLGNTTTWKLEELSKIKKMLGENDILATIKCYYSDVFLENTDAKLEPLWEEQLKYNRDLFHQEGEKYFHCEDVKNMSDLPIFSTSDDIEGYVDLNIISSLSPSTYKAFMKCNEKFYKSMDFTDSQIKYRNDRLITMYRIYSNYLNTIKNSVFLPMENMYERENIFSENGTCTMYLKLKR